MDPALRLGLELPSLASPATGTDRWIGAATAAERAGFGSVWVTGTDCDPCTLAGGLVPLTASIVLGVVSGVGAGDRNPSVLARDVTALDVLSSGRAAVLLQAGEGWGRLSEAAEVCRLLFTEDAPTFGGRHFHLAAAANRPRPVRPGGPAVLIQEPSPSSEVRGVGPAAAAALVVIGDPADVAAWREVVEGSPLIWRGELPPGDDAVPVAVALHEAGADGLIVRLAPDGEAPTGEVVVSTGRALVPLPGR
jgi:alkanesulfonate monooxygenase SsuD/methylene tetrahydromethanopterin reductase-like flavin-dependent oxidoreductase (luciferase family)